MTPKSKKLLYLQESIMLFIWVLLFAMPIFFSNSEDGINWQHIFSIWMQDVFLLIAFLINRFLLLPFLFYKGKRITYFISVITLITVLFGALYFSSPKRDMSSHPRPPMERQFNDQQGNGVERPLPPPHLGQKPKPPQEIPPYANFLILSILIIGFDTGLNVIMRWVQSEQNRVQLEKENVDNRLMLLRDQISPHFFMNTLNNIHALVDFDKDKAQGSIIKLSKLMGYMLYETKGKLVSFDKELQFVSSYVELMKLRVNDKVDIKLELPISMPEINIPPLLFISFIENAFKHGISYKKSSFIHIRFSIDQNKLNFEIQNSIKESQENDAHSGLGIENTVNRLGLLYGSKYQLFIDDHKEVFTVKLELPL